MLGCIGCAVSRGRKYGRLALIDWSLIAIGGGYGGAWALVAYFTALGENKLWENWLIPSESLYPVHTIFSIFLTASMWFGWKIAVGNPAFKKGYLFKSISRKQFFVVDEARLRKALWILLLISFSTQWLYARAYGGFVGMLDYSIAIRSGVFEIQNDFSFLRAFSGLVYFASFGFFGSLLTHKFRISTFIGLILSVLFSFYVLQANLGRVLSIVYISTFFLGWLLFKRKAPLILLGGGFICFALILFGAYWVSALFEINTGGGIWIFLVKELSFSFGSFFGQLEHGKNLNRGFIDFLVSPIYLLPSSWWGNWVEDVSRVNTTLIMGAPKGEQGVTGGIPVDLLTLGIMQAHFFGVIVVGLTFGFVLRLIQSVLDRIGHPGLRALFEAYIILKISILAIFYAQPSLVISNNFDLIFSLTFLLVFVARSKRMKY